MKETTLRARRSRLGAPVTTAPSPDRMALTSTVHMLEVDLSHIDRGLYQTISARIARHPSESAEYFVTRILAYCLEHTEGIEVSGGGLSAPDEPAIAVRDLTGKILTWIDIGMPEAPRLHKAAKSAARVVVYTHRDADRLVSRLGSERIHNAAALEIYAVEPALVDGLAARLERRLAFGLTVAEGQIMVAFNTDVVEGQIVRHPLGAG